MDDLATTTTLAAGLTSAAAKLGAGIGGQFIPQTTTLATTNLDQEQLMMKLANNLTTTAANSLLVPTNNNNNNIINISEEDELKLLNFPSKQEDLTTAIPLTVIFALLLVTGCIGNMCTAIVIARPKNKYMHTATNYYLFSLAMSDFLFLILGLPQEMYTLWQRYPYAFGESFCIIRGYLSEASTYASILTISAFTVERYVAICHPLWAHTMSQLPRAITSIVIIWILAAICAIPPAAELGIITQKGPITNRTLEQSAQCATKRTIFENMFVVSAIVFFIVPMIIVTVLYILIAIELRRSSKMNSAISKQTSSHLYNSHHHQNSSHLHSNKHCCDHHHHNHSHQVSGRLTNSNYRHYLNGNRQPLTGGGCHARRASRSQQQITCTISPSSSLGFSNQPNATHQTTDSSDPTPTGGVGGGSLMANIMSQRPSSVIGTEHPGTPANSGGQEQVAPEVDKADSLACSLGRLQQPSIKRPLSLWPLIWPGGGQNNQQQQQKKNHNCQCYLNQAACRQPNNRKLVTGTSHNNSHQLYQSQSHQYPPTTTACESITGGDSLSRQHSPLSYHESLIQRGQQTMAHSGAAAAAFSGRHLAGGLHQAQNNNNSNSNNDNNKQLSNSNQQQRESSKSLRPFPTAHQMSLNNSPSYQHQSNSVRNLSQQQHASCYHHQHGYHHHHHNHHNQQQQQHHYNSTTNHHSRRSAAASSKKSVIRMLVAVVVSFFICWVPFHAQRLLASYLVKDENQNQLLLDIYLKLTYISGVMYYLSSTINPLLYQLMSAKFRLAFKETFNCSLFKCAIFSRRSSGSPTNSLKQEPTLQLGGGGTSNGGGASHGHSTRHHHHLQHLDSKTSCQLGQREELSGSIYNGGGGGSATPAYAPDQHQSCCHLAAADDCCSSIDGRTNGGGSFNGGPPATPGMMARLRGRLNTSLVSLFRLSSNEDSSACCCCCCSSNPAATTTTTTTTCGNNNPHRYCIYNQLTASASKRSTTVEGESVCATPTPKLQNGGSSHQQQQSKRSGKQQKQRQEYGIRQLASCASIPLLNGCPAVDAHSTGAGTLLSARDGDDDQQQPQSRFGSQTNGGGGGGGGGSSTDIPGQAKSSPTTFAAHSMLKFIRSPTPLCSAGQPSLTRLSSREEDELSTNNNNNTNSNSRSQHSCSELTTTVASATCVASSDNNKQDRLLQSSYPLTKGSDRSSERVGTLMHSLIKPTRDEPDDDVDNLHVQSLTMTSESGNSSTVSSSPDQLQQQQQHHHHHHQQYQSRNNNNNNKFAASGLHNKMLSEFGDKNLATATASGEHRSTRQKLSSGSSNGSGCGHCSATNNGSSSSSSRDHSHHHHHHHHQRRHRHHHHHPPLAKNKRRRSSLQQTHNNTYLTQHNNYNNNPTMQEHQQRRKSSASSNTRHFSSSLSSSDRQLEKKLSLSTTTSAIEDCGSSSYTTTNSHLTGTGGSIPTLATQAGETDGLSSSRHSQSSAIDEDEPTTVINKSNNNIHIHSNHHHHHLLDLGGHDLSDTDNLNLIANEVKLPLLR